MRAVEGYHEVAMDKPTTAQIRHSSFTVAMSCAMMRLRF